MQFLKLRSVELHSKDHYEKRKYEISINTYGFIETLYSPLSAALFWPDQGKSAQLSYFS